MPSYSYVAIDKSGKERKSTIQADSPEQAAEHIRKAALVPVEVKEVGLLEKDIKVGGGGKKVKAKDLSVFCRQLVSMLQAGVTIVDSLGMLEKQTENKRLAAAIHETKSEVERGHTLSEAMANQDKVFPEMLINMVAASETTGNIEIAFGRMAIQFDKSSKISGMLKKSMAYPIVLLIVMIVIVIVMVVKIIPGYATTFADQGMELPAITRGMMVMSEFITKRWFVCIAIIVVAVLGIKAYKGTESGAMFFGKLAIRIPIFGKLNLKTYSSQFARTLSTMMSSGITMIDALDAVMKTMKNQVFLKHLQEAREEVAKGVPLSEPLRQGELFPPMVVHMISIGEETGDMQGMLDKLADYYDEEVEMTTQTVMAAMEPMIIVMMAVVVIILVAAIFAPMMSMYNMVGNS